MRGIKHSVEVKDWNRKYRRSQGKLTGIKFIGAQDESKPTKQVYWIPIKRKSRAGVEYINYKKVVDKIGLNKKDEIK